MKNLDGIKSGTYKVYTETSAYLIDFENNQAKRLPGEGLGANPNSRSKLEAKLVPLTEDNEWFKFITASCQLGREMVLWCHELVGEETYTHRYTTDVMRIEKVETI